MLRFFNTLTRKIEEFKPVIDNIVRIYSCGPTVYNFAHIGNWRTFVFNDLLRRYLKYKGFKVIHVTNITDVDDKTIKYSQKEGISLKEYTERYTKYFFEDMETLNIEKVEYYPKATEHIQEMITLIKELEKRGFAYVKNNSVYYRISKFKDYGKLARIDLNNLKFNAEGRLDTDEYDKENINDFALWKGYSEKDGNVFWESPWGKGRPGWHIECSVMSMKYLTKVFDHGFDPSLFETIDIHTGGVDLIFPHHTNEIAQTEAVVNKRFVNYWLHVEHLLVNGKKMSKSLGNFYTLRDLIKMGYSPRAIRYLLLSTHYRQQLNFTIPALKSAENTINKIDNFVFYIHSRIKIGNKSSENRVKILIDKFLNDFEKHMDNDLNISKALASLFTFINEIYKIKQLNKHESELVLNALKKVNSVLGIFKFEFDESIPDDLLELIKKRDTARKNKNYELADKIREELKKRGIELIDLPEGTIWKKIKKE